MGPIAVDLALMRDVLLPGLTLTPGRAVAARVVDAQGGRGTLSIAGYLVDAELPREVRAGDALRLEVRDVDAHRVLLAIADPETAQAQPPPATGVPLPGGATLTVLADEDSPGGAGGGAPGGQQLALSLQMEQLGAVELRFTLDAGSVRLDAALAPGEPFTRAQRASEALRAALADAAQRPAVVTVSARREPIDVYA